MLSSVEFRAGLQGPFYYILIWMYPSPTNIGTWRITSLLVGPVYNWLGLSCRTFILSWGKEEGPARKKNLVEGVPGPIGVVILPTQTMSLFSGEIPANYHTFALFDPPPMVTLMIPVKSMRDIFHHPEESKDFADPSTDQKNRRRFFWNSYFASEGKPGPDEQPKQSNGMMLQINGL